MAAIHVTHEPDARGDDVAVVNAKRLGPEFGLEDLVTEPSRIHECPQQRNFEDDASEIKRRAIGGGCLDDAWSGRRGALLLRLVKRLIRVRPHGIVLWPINMLAKPTQLVAGPIARGR